MPRRNRVKAQSLEFKQIFYSSFRCPNFVLNFFELFKLKTSDPVWYCFVKFWGHCLIVLVTRCFKFTTSSRHYDPI